MPGPACALALILMIDVSSSVQGGRYEQQRDGNAGALRSEEVRDAMAQAGDVAVEVVEWATGQVVTVPWTVVHEGRVDALADAIAATRRSGEGDTYMGGGLNFSLDSFGQAPCTPARRVIDVSGDGSSNAMQDSALTVGGPAPPEMLRDSMLDVQGAGQGPSRMLGSGYHLDDTGFQAAHRRAVSMHVQLNGLPIVTQAEPTVAEWYRKYLPANDGFVIVSQGFDSYEQAMLQKLTIEIGGLQGTLYADR